MKEMSFFKSDKFIGYAQLLLGCILGAIAYPLFLVPNKIAPGGVTGLSTVLNIAFGWPVGIVSYIMNIPLFIGGYAMLGKRFFLKSVLATTVFSLLIDFFSIFLPPMTDNPFLATLYGGGFLGVGLGFILRGGATTGGTDLSARLLNSKFRFISVGLFLFIQDLIVVIIAGIVIEVEAALYAAINIAVISWLLDITMQGLSREKAAYIISTKHEAINRRLIAEVQRGTTLFQAKGGFTGSDNPVIVCVFNLREMFTIKSIVKEEDERAFMFITSAAEVLGEGFKDLNEKEKI